MAGRQLVDMIAVVERALQRLGPSVHVHAELETKGVSTFGDAMQLEQLVLDLCTHAAQGGGRLTVRLEGVELSGEFARAHPPLTAGHHLRLKVENPASSAGAAVVDGVLSAHKGALTVSSEPGNGSSWELFLPARTSVDPVKPGHGERLMVVDDQANVARASAMLFEQLGFETIVFTDPHAALAAFRKSPQQFDLLMTDLTMPLMSGSELATAVHAVRAELPVIITTGLDVSEEERGALGLHVVLQKPWRVEDAVSALRRVLKD